MIRRSWFTIKCTPAQRVHVDRIRGNTSTQRKQVLVLIGGAPVTQSYADEIGADGYADDARTAVEKAKELLDVE